MTKRQQWTLSLLNTRLLADNIDIIIQYIRAESWQDGGGFAILVTTMI